jgi:copper chaperone
MEKEMKFKTSINCGGCVAKVTPLLNATKGINKWKVDTDNPDKILTVEPNGATESDVVEAVKRAGFKIERI